MLNSILGSKRNFPAIFPVVVHTALSEIKANRIEIQERTPLTQDLLLVGDRFMTD